MTSRKQASATADGPPDTPPPTPVEPTIGAGKETAPDCPPPEGSAPVEALGVAEGMVSAAVDTAENVYRRALEDISHSHAWNGRDALANMAREALAKAKSLG